MKRLVSRFILALGAAAITPTALLAQEGGKNSVADICTSPELADKRQKLWDFVAKQDKTEIYIAFLEMCGSTPEMAEYAAMARDVLLDRTANFTRMPSKTFRIVWEDNNEYGFTSVYIS